MNPRSVMIEVADACREISAGTPTLRVHDRPVGSIVPPALIVLFPEKINFDATYGRGSDTIDHGFLIVVGKPFEDSTADLIGEFAAGDGDRSLKRAIEAFEYQSCDDVRLVSLEFDVVRIGAIDYMAGVGALEIIGQGRAT